VLEGLNARPIGELSPSHEISQAQCYQWREQFPAIQEEIAIGMATSRFHRAGRPATAGERQRHRTWECFTDLARFVFLEETAPR
jgi:hypothetical protein